MDTICQEYEKVVKKQKLITDETTKNLDTLISKLTDARAALNAASGGGGDPTSSTATASLLVGQSKDLTHRISEKHKELHGALSKYSKWLEKQKYFKTDLNNIWDPQAFTGNEDILHQILAMHFIREGKFELGDLFAKEAGLDVPDSLKGQFVEMYQIQEAMRAGELGPAIEWACKKRFELGQRGSSLEFQLHRLQFIKHLVNRETDQALVYAKTKFTPFAQQHMKEIQRLMCSFLFAARLQSSPYADFLDPNLSIDIQRQFTRDFCQLLGLSSESPLYIAITAGTLALPTIIKMSLILKDKSGLEWSAQGELPVEVPLLDSHRFHYVFACPVSKEQSTEENPPMMMACGHVIAKESLTRLSKGNLNTRFKCPYCPTESTASQAVRIYF
ncbi:hypothetical protein HK102_008399 [Quaeritorhiza haematococci]|nr:hypothetical protein HK102_008399 [Quaeritorhiza haematococci]